MLNIPKTHSSNLSNVQLLPSMYQHDTDTCVNKNKKKTVNQCVKYIYNKDTVNQCVKFIYQQAQSTNVSKLSTNRQSTNVSNLSTMG